MVLHFDVDEPKPLDQMTEAELDAYGGIVVHVEAQLHKYMLTVMSAKIKRTHERHDTERAASGGVIYKAPSEPQKNMTMEEFERFMNE